MGSWWFCWALGGFAIAGCYEIVHTPRFARVEAVPLLFAVQWAALAGLWSNAIMRDVAIGIALMWLGLAIVVNGFVF
ncbi:MAG: hypothetical protein C7B46_17140 [Sulfobacillus benefaciens]|uniref:Uncharacterized protein n=1 Tax=Sulfobacillus benefaciens TaxID=453960 RepID=A0A2T2X9L6_9FIRM|nr:MAG: hypothetical protein C7B46_17140 [Sulfobacillus benefaciens]